MTDYTQELVELLKEHGFVVGIISDSYDCITTHLKNKYAFDFSLGNELEFSKSIATGEVKIPSFYLPHPGSICKHEYCKSHALTHICKKLDVSVSDTLAIGDGLNDICLIDNAGIGVSFCSADNRVNTVADFVIKEPDFSKLFPIVA